MFALAKCGHCNGTHTKAVVIEPSDSQYKQIAITCSSCSSILGVTSYYNTAVKLGAIETKVDDLTKRLKALEYNVSQIVNALSRR